MPKPLPALESADPRAIVAARMKELRLSLKELSRAVGKNEAYMHQYMTRNVPRRLPEDVRDILKEVLGVPESMLREPNDRRRMAGATSAPLLKPGLSFPPSGFGKTVPVHVEGEAISEDTVTAWTLWVDDPHATGAFALWVNAPHGRLQPGDLAYVCNTPPPRAGDVVVAIRGDDIAAIGTLVAMSTETISVDTGSGKPEVIARSGLAVRKVHCVRLP